MPKYSERDDGKTVEGKVVIFLRAPWRGEPPPDPDDKGKKDAKAKAGGEEPTTGDAALAEKAKNYKFHIEVQLHAKGGTPLATEKVRIVDPDSKADVNIGETDDKGVLRAKVPAKKDYHIFVHDQDVADTSENAFDGVAQDPAHGDRHPVLSVAVSDASGQPAKGEKVQIKGEDGFTQELATDDDGYLHVPVAHGLYTLSARGKEMLAHTVFTDDKRAEGAAYVFRLR
ncbi:MAG TPA: hypothetical protein VLW85_25715 [Myxococcales bacterium]|nr:hypothetical protein [Myxococcales bacterium]